MGYVIAVSSGAGQSVASCSHFRSVVAVCDGLLSAAKRSFLYEGGELHSPVGVRSYLGIGLGKSQ